MAINKGLDGREFDSIIESTETANQPARAVVNPDGTNIMDGSTIDVTTKDTVTSIPGAPVSVGTTPVEITASADQRWLRVVPTSGRFRWNGTVTISASAEEFTRSSPLILNLETGSIFIEKTSGGAVDVMIYRGVG